MGIIPFAQYISEASYTSADIPNKFYVSIQTRVGYNGSGMDFSKQNTFQHLSDGVLEGVVGLSGTKENIADWFTSRDILVVMNAQATLAVNKLSRVNYDKPNYALSDNMKNLKRVANLEHEDNNGVISFSFINHMLSYINSNKGISSDYSRIFDYMSSKAEDELVDFEVGEIHHTEHMVRVIQRVLDNGGVETSPEVVHRIVTETLSYWLNLYSFEQEWIVKNGVLTIPHGSLLLFKSSVRRADSFQHHMNPTVIKNAIAHYNLRERYKVSIIDTSDVQRYGSIVSNKRSGRGTDIYI